MEREAGPLVTKEDWHLRHAEGARLLRRAHLELQLPSLRDRFLAAPLSVRWSFHDTGSHVQVLLATAGVPTLVVWHGSSWISSSYKVNDRNKVLGFNPEVPFAHDAALEFLLRCQDELLARRARQAAEKIAAETARSAERAYAIETYRALMTGADR
jgi:hypothetical protein